MALRNIWLRQRVSTWELKTGNHAKVDPENLHGLGTTYYVYVFLSTIFKFNCIFVNFNYFVMVINREREGEESISQELDRYDFFQNAPSVSSKLSLLQPLAIIETTRTSYRLYVVYFSTLFTVYVFYFARYTHS